MSRSPGVPVLTIIMQKDDFDQEKHTPGGRQNADFKVS